VVAARAIDATARAARAPKPTGRRKDGVPKAKLAAQARKPGARRP
jgi:hypothetical protein